MQDFFIVGQKITGVLKKILRIRLHWVLFNPVPGAHKLALKDMKRQADSRPPSRPEGTLVRFLDRATTARVRIGSIGVATITDAATTAGLGLQGVLDADLYRSSTGCLGAHFFCLQVISVDLSGAGSICRKAAHFSL